MELDPPDVVAPAERLSPFAGARQQREASGRDRDAVRAPVERADGVRGAAEESALEMVKDYEAGRSDGEMVPIARQGGLHPCPVASSTRACRRRIPSSQRSWSSPLRR